MHICVLTHACMPFGMDYASAFAARGHRVEILSLTPSGNDYHGIPVRCVGPTNFAPLHDWHVRYAEAILPVRRAVRELNPDILMAVYITSTGTLACMTGHPRIVLSAHGSDINDHLTSRLWRAVFRWQFRKAKLVHIVSQYMADTLHRQFGIDPARMLVAPVGTDTQFFQPIPMSERPNAGQILCVRAHKPIYDQATLVRAMVRLRDKKTKFHVTFAHPTMAERTVNMVRQAGLEAYATFLPGYKPAELPRLLAGADVYVSTSITDGTSVSLMEAMSTATFPVVSDIPANQPWVEDGKSGYLFKVGDDEALAERLAESLQNPRLRESGGERSRQIVVQRGDFNVHVERLLDSFAKIIADTTTSKAAHSNGCDNNNRSPAGDVITTRNDRTASSCDGIQWPNGKKFAFTIVDDTDCSTLENIKPVYEYLLDHGIVTTKTVWPVQHQYITSKTGTTLADGDYRDFVLSLRDRGVEIAFHGATSHSSNREETIHGLECFKGVLGNYPSLHCNHHHNSESIYWGRDRLNTRLARLIYSMATVRRNLIFEGHCPESPHFWGDYCQRHIKYVRNFVFNEINLLKINPSMPYHVPSMPYVNLWFSSCEAPNVERFCGLLTGANLDRLESEGGLCILYAHLANGFMMDGRLNPQFVNCVDNLSRRPGYFVTASEILDFMVSKGRGGNIPPAELKNMERKWIIAKLKGGTS